jgi:hypothetical protein
MCNLSNLDRRWKRLPMAMLLLAFAVFGWGLHYKLTLYEQGPQVRASEPAAKLLSERERGSAKAKPAATELSKPPLEAAILISIAMGLLPKLTCFSGFRLASRRRKAFIALFENSLFMRPPPGAFSLS